MGFFHFFLLLFFPAFFRREVILSAKHSQIHLWRYLIMLINLAFRCMCVYFGWWLCRSFRVFWRVRVYLFVSFSRRSPNICVRAWGKTISKQRIKMTHGVQKEIQSLHATNAFNWFSMELLTFSTSHTMHIFYNVALGDFCFALFRVWLFFSDYKLKFTVFSPTFVFLFDPFRWLHALKTNSCTLTLYAFRCILYVLFCVQFFSHIYLTFCRHIATLFGQNLCWLSNEWNAISINGLVNPL